MYNVVFRRQSYSEEGYCETDGTTKIFRCSTRDEVIQTITKCCNDQLDLEYADKVKYGKHFYGKYGDWDFLVLYKGYLHYVGGNFDDDISEDYASLWDDGSSVLDEIHNLDVLHLIREITLAHMTYHKIIDTFIETEVTIGGIQRMIDKQEKVEKDERELLQKLLQKYPNMVK